MENFYVTVTAGFYVRAQDAQAAGQGVGEGLAFFLEEKRSELAAKGLQFAEVQPHEVGPTKLTLTGPALEVQG